MKTVKVNFTIFHVKPVYVSMTQQRKEFQYSTVKPWGNKEYIYNYIYIYVCV